MSPYAEQLEKMQIPKVMGLWGVGMYGVPRRRSYPDTRIPTFTSYDYIYFGGLAAWIAGPTGSV